MKFVCESCKAKYQIGDEKVAGKTLRMKCRRCGHLIQVAASVTESSVSTKLPTVEPPAPPAPADPTADEGATIVRASPLFLFQNQANEAQPSTPASPGAPPQDANAHGRGPGIPRPVHGGPVHGPSVPGGPVHSGGLPPARSSMQGLNAPPAPPSQVGGFSAQRGQTSPTPLGPRLVPPARPSQRNSQPPGAPVPRAPLRSAPMINPGGPAAGVALAQSSFRNSSHSLGIASAQEAEAPAASPSSPALYNGFAQAVAAPTSSATPVLTEDWYVGIAGVPLGPVRLSVLREKASQGQVDGDSLVWREGFDEWLPVRKIPGLLEVVDEAKTQRTSRGSLTPVPAALPKVEPPRVEPVKTEIAPIPAPAVSQPFDLLRPSAAASPAGMVRDPFAAPAPLASDPGGAAPVAAAGATVVADPFAPPPTDRESAVPVAPPPGAVTGSLDKAAFGLSTTASLSASESIAPPRKKGLHPMAWAFIAMAAAFGGVAAWAIFLRKPDVVYLPGQATARETAPDYGSPPPPPPPTSDAKTAAAQDDTSAPVASASSSAVAISNGGGPRGLNGGVSTSKSSEPAAPIDTSGFNNGGSPAGPKTADTSTGGGGALGAAEAEGVVARNSPRVRRACWDQQVAARPSDAPRSVKVNVTVKVAPNGKVSSATASGGNEKYYPGLTSCVQSAVSGWSFPTSGEGGTFNVPFSFNAQ